MRFLSVVAVVVLMLPGAAFAQSCGKRSELIEHFKQKYGEEPVLTARTEAGNVLEVLASERGTWTMLTTTPIGQSCPFGSGDGIEIVRKDKRS